jgi:osmotically-inducible protein OsmY
MLIGALAGCATYEKCGLEGCASDRKISAQVETLLNAHPELGPPGSISVETLNGVVYLDGLVSLRAHCTKDGVTL